MADQVPTVYRGGSSPRTPSRTRRGLQLLREVSRWALTPPTPPPSPSPLLAAATVKTPPSLNCPAIPMIREQEAEQALGPARATFTPHPAQSTSAHLTVPPPATLTLRHSDCDLRRLRSPIRQQHVQFSTLSTASTASSSSVDTARVPQRQQKDAAPIAPVTADTSLDHDKLSPDDVAAQLNIFTAANKPTASHDMPVVALAADHGALRPQLLEVTTPAAAPPLANGPPVPPRDDHYHTRRRSITSPSLGATQQADALMQAQQTAKLAPVVVPEVPVLSRVRSAWVMLRSLSDGAHIRNGTIAEKLEDEGISIISDIDDTIKVTQVHSSKAIIMNTFLRAFAPVAGMAELYRRWRDELKASFHYVSASPFHLYTAISNFLVAENFPTGSVHLRKVESMTELFEPPRRTKRESIHALMQAHPRRRFVFVGDSSEMDPEIFSELATEQPRNRSSQIIAIFIRRVDSGWANNSHERFRAAFSRVRPDIMCAAFSSPNDIDQLLRKHLTAIGAVPKNALMPTVPATTTIPTHPA